MCVHFEDKQTYHDIQQKFYHHHKYINTKWRRGCERNKVKVVETRSWEGVGGGGGGSSGLEEAKHANFYLQHIRTYIYHPNILTNIHKVVKLAYVFISTKPKVLRNEV